VCHAWDIGCSWFGRKNKVEFTKKWTKPKNKKAGQIISERGAKKIRAFSIFRLRFGPKIFFNNFFDVIQTNFFHISSVPLKVEVERKSEKSSVTYNNYYSRGWSEKVAISKKKKNLILDAKIITKKIPRKLDI